MFYIIYKTTNKINNKFYIGKHQTNDLNDGYLGSGTLLKRAIQKHGRQNFKKEVLFVFDNEQDMNSKEKELVVVSEDTYNLCEGGQGGFGYINRNGLNIDIDQQRKLNPNLMKKAIKNRDLVLGKLRKNKKWKEKYSLKMKEIMISRYQNGFKPTFLGKTHSEKSKKLIGEKNSIHQQGSNNSQFGTIWNTNGLENRKIKKEDIIPDGWNRGRI